MKSVIQSIAVLSLVLSSTSAAQAVHFDGEKVVYGRDNRVEITETSPLYARLAASTAAMIGKGSLADQRNGTFVLRGITLRLGMGVCSYERFANQVAAANCSGFLVGKDLLVTAGHCVENSYDCNSYRWVFDYNQSSIETNGLSISAKNIYSCKTIVSRALNGDSGLDYALIQLDREVTDREPLKVRREGKVRRGAKLLVIGHPSGLPTKVSAGARVRLNSKETYFESNLDTFGGNSGSAVFNAKTGEVEGILVRGATDYKYDRKNSCMRVKHCMNFTCRGEDVTRITLVPGIPL